MSYFGFCCVLAQIICCEYSLEAPLYNLYVVTKKNCILEDYGIKCPKVLYTKMSDKMAY